MKGFVVTRVLADGAMRYDALWRANGKQKQETFAERHDAGRFIATAVKRVQDGNYQSVQPILTGEVFDMWITGELDYRQWLGSLKASTAKKAIAP